MWCFRVAIISRVALNSRVVEVAEAPLAVLIVTVRRRTPQSRPRTRRCALVISDSIECEREDAVGSIAVASEGGRDVATLFAAVTRHDVLRVVTHAVQQVALEVGTGRTPARAVTALRTLIEHSAAVHERDDAGRAVAREVLSPAVSLRIGCA